LKIHDFREFSNLEDY